MPHPKSLLFPLLFPLLLTLATTLHAQAPCPTVHNLADFLPAWEAAVQGPGSRSHTCTLALLTPDARISGAMPNKAGFPSLTTESPAEFVGWYQNHPSEPFFERTLHSTTELYDNVARLTRTYEVRDTPTSPVKARGIEHFWLLFDGSTWRAFAMLWQDEAPNKPLPSIYLPK